ncbi:MAG: hypothetical protein NTX79_05950 [Candidatus Micrarchaeota archaeon]|nr:hypothetical protein [Candidatus Micrarchaeota archaeon]
MKRRAGTEPLKLGNFEPLFTVGSEYPVWMRITPAGVEKSRENTVSRIIDTAYANPWAVITVVIALIGIIVAGYFQNQAAISQAQVSQLITPKLVLPDTRVYTGQTNEIKFTVFNPSDNEYFYEGGNCTPLQDNVFEVPTVQQSTSPSLIQQSQTVQVLQQKTNDRIIPPHAEITLYCVNNYVVPSQKDFTTEMNICVKIRDIENPLCRKMSITVLSS